MGVVHSDIVSHNVIIIDVPCMLMESSVPFPYLFFFFFSSVCVCVFVLISRKDEKFEYKKIRSYFSITAKLIYIAFFCLFVYPYIYKLIYHRSLLYNFRIDIHINFPHFYIYLFIV